MQRTAPTQLQASLLRARSAGATRCRHAPRCASRARGTADAAPTVARVSRRAVLASPLLLAASAPGAALLSAPLPARGAEAIAVEADEPGFGARAAADGDLLLVHYVGTLADGGALFDTTRGGAVVRTNGMSSFSVQPAEAAPRVVSLRASDVQPGVVPGLRAALLGMRVGGRRAVTVPPALGFGQTPVAAPFGDVPLGSTLRYDIQVLRISSTGPDALLAGIAQCGIGGAAAQVAGCGAIEPSE